MKRNFRKDFVFTEYRVSNAMSGNSNLSGDWIVEGFGGRLIKAWHIISGHYSESAAIKALNKIQNKKEK